MEFKARKIIINASSPFDNDKLNRKPQIENLSLLLKNISTPIVLSVNAPWGQGKTAFMEMLHANLKNEEFKSIYFSAWETDFASDPLLAFLGEMDKEFNLLVKDDDVKSEAWKNAKKAGSHLLKKGIPAIIKVGTAGLLDAEKMIEDEASKFMEGISKDYIEEYTKNKNAISKFKYGVSKVLNNKDEPITKVFIFIDELDRCRPTYAIELLERIKHLLDIEGLVFVLAMDKKQLAHSVKGVYGAEFESISYLRRFIDIEYSLPESDLDLFIEKLYENFDFNSFFEKRNNYADFRYERNNLKGTFKLLASKKELSLREVEQLLSKVNLVIHSTPINVFLNPELLAFLLLVKEFAVDVYKNYLKPTSTPEVIIEYLYDLVPEKERYDSSEFIIIESYLIAAKVDFSDSVLGSSLSKHELCDGHAGNSGAKKRYSARVCNIVHDLTRGNSGISLSGMSKRIAMIENFSFAET